jgi:DNA-binding transcriptional LysR family regulator
VDIRHLRYFQAVAEELSFTRAASRLNVAQSALSRAVKELESFVEALLLERSRHYVRLTPAGTVLLREAGLLLERLDETVRKVRRTAAGEEEELRLGYIGPPTQVFLGRLLKEYRRRYPRVHVHLEERTPERIWEMVAKGRLAMGITRSPAGQEALGLKTTLLRHEPLCIAVPPEHPLAKRRSVSWKQLNDHALIALARREGISLHDAVVAGCRKAGFTPHFAHTPSLIGTVLSYAEAGAGVAVVTDSVAQSGAKLLFIPLSPKETVPLVVVWHDDRNPPAAQRFRQILMDWQSSGHLWGPTK